VIPPTNKTRFPIVEIHEAMMLTGNHFAQSASRDLYYYEGGVYIPGGEEFIRRRARSLLESWAMTNVWSKRSVYALIDFIAASAPNLAERPHPSILNLKNGLLDIDKIGKGRELLPHDHNHLSSIQLPINYNPQATCRQWDRFLASVFPEDAGQFALEIIGYVLVPDTSLQKAFILLGSGANGKSTFFKAIEENLLSRRNVSHRSMHQLSGDKFAAHILNGKLANFCPDVPGKKILDSSLLKQIISGDPIVAEGKGRNAYDLWPFVRLFFSANVLPTIVDADDALYRRFLLIYFGKEFNGKVFQSTIVDGLGSEEEKSGIFNKAIQAYKSLITQGAFSIPPSVKELTDEFKSISDPFGTWLRDHTVDAGQVAKAALREAYNKANPTQTLTDVLFSKYLLQRRKDIRTVQPRIEGGRVWAWAGISLKGQKISLNVEQNE